MFRTEPFRPNASVLVERIQCINRGAKSPSAGVECGKVYTEHCILYTVYYTLYRELSIVSQYRISIEFNTYVEYV